MATRGDGTGPASPATKSERIGESGYGMSKLGADRLRFATVVIPAHEQGFYDVFIGKQ